MTIDEIRNAIRNGQVVLDRGTFRVKQPYETVPASAALVPANQHGSPGDSGGGTEVAPRVTLKPTTWAFTTGWVAARNLEDCDEESDKDDGTSAAVPSFDRDEWTHWVDEDDDCQNTRVEVLRVHRALRPRGKACHVPRA